MPKAKSKSWAGRAGARLSRSSFPLLEGFDEGLIPLTAPLVRAVLENETMRGHAGASSETTEAGARTSLPSQEDSERKFSSDSLHSVSCFDSKGDSDDVNIRSDLRRWMLEENITQKAGTSLLKLLKKHKCFTDLPQDSRSLLKTPRATAVEADINVVTPGKYCHFGLLDGLRQTLQGFEELPSVVNLYFNIDGLPVSKSSKTQLWPIQCKLAKCELPPFMVGIYEGKTKPKCSNEFLSRFNSELKTVLADGVEVGAKVVKISVKGFVCDFPARAFVFMTKGVQLLPEMHCGRESSGKSLLPRNSSHVAY